VVDAACRLAAETGTGVFLLGSSPANAERASRTLVSRHPGLRIAGSFAPPFGPHSAADEAQMVARIRDAGRCVLFVAFGAPRQDRFIQAHLAELDVPIAIGVGGTFDILAGALRRAPAWLQEAGFEWLWRLSQEPRRLWRRYLVKDAPFLLRLGARAMRASLRPSVQPL
jgi:N-acetylglucosaminyldiphosphoundecaprenol N-acetyl-beta-D-mannosaminyltransferase